MLGVAACVASVPQCCCSVLCCNVLCSRKSLEPHAAASAMASLLDTVCQVENQSHPQIRPVARAFSSSRVATMGRMCQKGDGAVAAALVHAAATCYGQWQPRRRQGRQGQGRQAQGRHAQGRRQGRHGAGATATRVAARATSTGGRRRQTACHLAFIFCCADACAATIRWPTTTSTSTDNKKKSPMPSWRMLRCERLGCGTGGGRRAVRLWCGGCPEYVQ